jgi:hypothetical protein
MLKGTVSQDLFLLVFFMGQFPPGCTLQINEPQLQCSKHQCAKHQRATHQPRVVEVQSTLDLQKLCRSTAPYINEKTLEGRLLSWFHYF